MYTFLHRSFPSVGVVSARKGEKIPSHVSVIPIPQKETDSHTPAICTLPPTIMSLHHPRYTELNEKELKFECKRVFEQELVVTQAEADYLEQSYKLQSQSLTWFSHRRGRITALKFGSVFHTSLFSPAVSCGQSPVCAILDSSCLQRRSSEWCVL